MSLPILEDVNNQKQVNDITWLTKSTSDPESPKHRITIDVFGYKPSSIKTELQSGKLILTGLDEVIDGENFSKKEFRKILLLPSDVEAEKFSSFVTNNGELIVDIPYNQEKISITEQQVNLEVAEQNLEAKGEVSQAKVETLTVEHQVAEEPLAIVESASVEHQDAAEPQVTVEYVAGEIQAHATQVVELTKEAVEIISPQEVTSERSEETPPHVAEVEIKEISLTVLEPSKIEIKPDVQEIKTDEPISQPEKQVALENTAILAEQKLEASEEVIKNDVKPVHTILETSTQSEHASEQVEVKLDILQASEKPELAIETSDEQKSEASPVVEITPEVNTIITKTSEPKPAQEIKQDKTVNQTLEHAETIPQQPFNEVAQEKIEHVQSSTQPEQEQKTTEESQNPQIDQKITEQFASQSATELKQADVVESHVPATEVLEKPKEDNAVEPEPAKAN